MDIMLMRTFQRQVALQCQFILYAATDLQSVLNKHDAIADHINRIFYALQNLMTASANVSKALWGQRGKLASERKPLRDSIGISDTSPLRDVVMRNNFEHYDERLDRWWAQSAQHNHADLNVGPKSMISGIAEIDRFRMFDPQSKEIIFWGEDFNLQRLIEEVENILPKLLEEADKPHWE